MNYNLIMAAVSALAIGNSLFFGLYLFYKKSYSNKLLALLLIALALRISKSVIAIAFPDAPLIVPATGLTGMAAIGPFFYLYVRSLFGIKFKKAQYFHFVPSFLIAVTVAFINDDIMYFYYQAVVGQILVYIIISSVNFIKKFDDLKKERLKISWCKRLFTGVTVIWLAFLYQLFSATFLSYVVATAVAVIVLYVLSFWSMQRGKIFQMGSINNFDHNQLKLVAHQIDQLFKEEKLYLQDNITLTGVSSMIKQQPYLVSKSINVIFHQTFPELVNSYRVKEAQKKLLRDQNSSLSIESIAYDSGFSTLSSFYSVFKKEVRMTPSEFRNRSIK